MLEEGVIFLFLFFLCFLLASVSFSLSPNPLKRAASLSRVNLGGGGVAPRDELTPRGRLEG